MPLFPRRRRKNRRFLEILQRIRQDNRDTDNKVSKEAESNLRQVVSNAELPDEVNEFLEPFLGDRRLLGLVFTKFSSALDSRDADDVLDDDQQPRRQGALLELLFGFIGSGGLSLILEFIISLMSAFDDD
jgi:hypothetical protein